MVNITNIKKCFKNHCSKINGTKYWGKNLKARSSIFKKSPARYIKVNDLDQHHEGKKSAYSVLLKY